MSGDWTGMYKKGWHDGYEKAARNDGFSDASVKAGQAMLRTLREHDLTYLEIIDAAVVIAHLALEHAKRSRLATEAE